jgi:hypothetical protein
MSFRTNRLSFLNVVISFKMSKKHKSYDVSFKLQANEYAEHHSNEKAAVQASNPCSGSALAAGAPDLEMEVECDTDGEEEDDENEVFIDSDDRR